MRAGLVGAAVCCFLVLGTAGVSLPGPPPVPALPHPQATLPVQIPLPVPQPSLPVSIPALPVSTEPGGSLGAPSLAADTQLAQAPPSTADQPGAGASSAEARQPASRSAAATNPAPAPVCPVLGFPPPGSNCPPFLGIPNLAISGTNVLIGGTLGLLLLLVGLLALVRRSRLSRLHPD